MWLEKLHGQPFVFQSRVADIHRWAGEISQPCFESSLLKVD